MSHTSLRTRVMTMTALPAFMAALIIGGYTLATQVMDVRADNAHRQQLIVESYAARLAALDGDDQESYQALLRDLLEQPNVRAATLFDSRAGWQLHTGPRLRPVEKAEHMDDGINRLITDSGWQLVRPLPGPGQRMLTVEFSHQGQYVRILEAVLAMIAVVTLLIILAVVPATHFSRRLTRPVRTLIDNVRRVRDGDLTTPTRAQSIGELADLEDALREMVAALNEAQAELQQNVDQATQDLRETLETIEIQNIELDMARKEALKASQIKSEFLANMSHEIRTPLNGIIGFTRLLERSSMSPSQQDYLGTIRKSAESLLSIINDILDFSKIEAGKLSLEHIPLDLHDTIEDVQTMLAPMAQDKGLEQAAIIYNDVPTRLLGDPLRIRQVLTNLVSNAIKFTERGSVVVRAMLEEERGAEAVVKITITDTGNGLPPEMQKSLFNAFTQLDQSRRRQEGGTGLGLAICKRLVEGMGGEIGIDSTIGHGSTFWFTLRAERDLGAEPEPAPIALEGLSVTLVEANEHARLALYHMLGGWRMRVTELQALDTLETHLDNDSLAPSDFYVLAVPASQQDPAALEPLMERLAKATGKPLLILAAHADTLAGHLTGLPGPCRVLGKPATRRSLRESLLELGGLAAPAAPHNALGPLGKRARVLLVDDHPGNLKLARVFLEEMGVEVTACDGGEAALTAFAKGTFDLVFMDVQMPRLDGMETTRRIREREGEGPRTPIIALTAHALESERRSLLAAGMDDYLSKPITEGQLRHTLNHWVHGNDTDEPEPEPDDDTGPDIGAEDTRAQEQPPVLSPELALRRAGDREELAEDMLTMLLASLDQDAPGINALSESHDREGLLERVHRLHGATRYCGTPRLEAAAGALEKALKLDAGDESLDQLVAALLTEIESVRQAARRES